MKNLDQFLVSPVKISTILLFTLFISLSINPVLDTDFGWHLKIGEYIFETGSVPKTDLFSYTNSDYPLINNSILSDLTFYVLFKLADGRIYPHVLLVAAMLFVAFLWLLPSSFMDKALDFEDRIIFALLGLTTAQRLIYLNPIVYDYAGFAAVLFILEKYKKEKNTRILWFTPLVLFFWTNLHAGFTIGFALFGLYILSELIEFVLGQTDAETIKKEIKTLLFFLAASFTATILNPYGIRIYQEIFNIFSSTLVSGRIMYWQPSFMSASSAFFYVYFLLFVLFLVFSRRIPAVRFIVYAAFWGATGFWALRFYPFFILSTILVLRQIDAKKAVLAPLMLFTIFFAAFIIYTGKGVKIIKLFVPSPGAVKFLFSKRQVLYFDAPVGAFEFLKKYAEEGKIGERMFNEFDWGGALTWYLPERKVFINGYMPHWKDERGHEILADFGTIRNLGQNWQEFVDYYAIDWFLVMPKAPVVQALKLMPDTWEMVYEDEKAVVFVKK